MPMNREDGNSSIHTHGTLTVRDLLSGHEATSRYVTGTADNMAVEIILICGDGSPGLYEEALASVPHMTFRLEDNLLYRIRELREENEKLRSLTLIDNLTGLGNKRFFWMQLETEMARTKRTGHSCTLMMIDLDNFKGLNDTFGHLEGDRFLEEFGKIMRENCRSTDLPCRYGGDEFALIMPATTMTEALKTAERLKKMLTDVAQKSNPPISLSVGVSEYSTFSPYSMNEFVAAADTALYEAKGSGKNRIRIDSNWKDSAVGDNEVNIEEKDALFSDYE